MVLILSKISPMMTKSSIRPQGRKVVTSGSGIRTLPQAIEAVTFSFASPKSERRDGEQDRDTVRDRGWGHRGIMGGKQI